MKTTIEAKLNKNNYKWRIKSKNTEKEGDYSELLIEIESALVEVMGECSEIKITITGDKCSEEE